MTVSSAQKTARFARSLKRNWLLLAMMALPLAYYVIFCYLPMYGVQMAFRDYKVRLGMWASPWIGFTHFRNFLTDAYFWKLVRNTVLLNVWGLAFGFPAPIVYALLLNELSSNTFRRVAQTIAYLPHFISTVVVCAMITNFFAINGAINDVLEALIGRRVHFLTTPSYFRPLYTFSGVWQGMGWGSIIYMAALTNVDLQLYEAAVIDGANRWQQMLHVTLPSLVPTISIMLILQIGGMMGVGLEKVMLLYSGMVYETADVIATFVYRRGLVDAKFSYATAVGVFQSVIGLILLSGANQFSRRFSESSLW